MKILDTAVLIDIDRGNDETLDKVRRLDEEGKHAISIVSVTELYLGLEKKYEKDSEEYERATADLEKLISRFEVLPIDRPVAVTGAKIIADLQGKGEPLHDLHDVYIGATAKTRQLTVLTPNLSHFERIEDIQVQDWSEY
jgi:tRNA(fMet)-specific endonuclease VapC